MPQELEKVLPHLDGIAQNHATLVGYLGPDFCVSCKLNESGLSCKAKGGTKRCGSTLNLHKDNLEGEGGNSQSRSRNETINIGDSRTLSMVLCNPDRIPYPAEREDFVFSDGTRFGLHPRDEQLCYRTLHNGEVAMGAWEHGMLHEIQRDGISAGVVFRHVIVAVEVDVKTHWVIMDRAQRQYYETHVLEMENVPAGARCIRDTRANMEREAREMWAQRAPRYVAAVHPLVERAWERWGVKVTP